MNKSVKFKLLCAIATLCLLVTGVFAVINVMNTLPKDDKFSADTMYSSNYNLASNIQDGVTLHCFDWKYNDIKAELANIAAAGFTSVQTSPAQPAANPGVWYWLYQPLGFYAASNNLGSPSELASLCSEADKYGIKVIVDVVANHLAGDHSNIQSDLKASQYWHTYGTVYNWSDRYQVVNGNIGMPDLNSENSYVQQVVANYVNELKDLGVDGIRWDAAKHIALPSEGCNFWPAVTSQGLYHYGEILVGPDDRTSGNEGLMVEYTKYMSVTDSSYGKTLRDAFNFGTVPASYGNWAARGVSNDKLVYWGESHDTWSNNQDWGYSNGMSQNVIDRAYAIAASRNDVSALYFSRPSSTYKESILQGQKGSTHFTSPEVAEVNKFHNAMIGQKDYYTTGNNCAVVSRELGAVVAAGSGSNFTVTVPNGGSTTAPGTYVDQITGSTWTVTSTTMTGYIGSSGIAVLYNPENGGNTSNSGSTDNSSTISAGTIYFSNPNSWNNVYAYYWSDANTKMTTWPGIKMTLKNGVYSVDVPDGVKYIIFNDGNNNQTEDLKVPGTDYIYNGSWSVYEDTTVEDNTTEDTNTTVDGNIFYQNTSNWSSVYAYYWSSSNTKMTTWPGVKMTSIGNGLYGLTIPEDAEYIIFTNGNGAKTGDIELEGLNKVYNNGIWSNYNTSSNQTEESNRYIYFKNTSNWSSVYAYYWSDANTKMTTWPGIKMENLGNGIYRVELPMDAEYVIFTNGMGSQTGDIKLNGFGKIYNNGTWSTYN